MPVGTAQGSSIGIPPETELLFLLARTRLSPDTAKRVTTLLDRELDWIFFVRDALSHDLLPLVYAHLKAVDSRAMPAAIHDQLARYFEQHVRRNDRLVEELLRLLALLAAHSIPALVFKGPVQAVAAYGDLSLRTFCDLDFLIRRRDALPAKEVFLGAGYQLKTPLGRGGFPSEPGKYEYAFHREDDGAIAELRWRLTPRYVHASLDVERLGGRRAFVPIRGAAVPTLTAEDTLVMLCVHGAKHYWGVLKWICDVAELIGANPRMNWPVVEAEARQLGCWRMVALGLRLASDLLGAAVPEEVMEIVRRDGRVSGLAARVEIGLLKNEDPPPGADEAMPYRPGELIERFSDGVWNGLRVARRVLTYSFAVRADDTRFLALPRPLRIGYYPLRCLRRLMTSGFGPLARQDW